MLRLKADDSLYKIYTFLILALAIIFYIQPKPFLAVAFVVFIIRHFFRKISSSVYIALFLIYSLLLVDNLFAYVDVFQPLKLIQFNSQYFESGLLISIMSLATGIVLMFLIKKLISTFPSLFNPLLLIFAYILALYVLAEVVQLQNFSLIAITIPSLIFFFKSSWVSAFLSNPRVKNKDFFIQIFHPAFIRFFDNRPFGLLTTRPLIGENYRNELIELCRFTFFYLSIVLVTLILKIAYGFFYFFEFSLASIFNENLFIAKFHESTRHPNLVNVLFSSIVFYVDVYFYSPEIAILSARLFGFSLPSFTNSPWQAKSFKDFFFRSSYYYCAVLIYFFYIPTKRLFNRLSALPKNLTTNLSLFISIFVGGFSIHYLRLTPVLFQGGASLFALIHRYLLYFLTFAIFSVFIHFSLIKNNYVRFCIFICLFAVLRYLSNFGGI